MAENIILVEGQSDKSFFEAVLKKISLTAVVRVYVPKDRGTGHNSKQGVLNKLSTELKNIQDNNESRLAVILDADSQPNGGLQHTLDQFDQKVNPDGYFRDLSKNLNNQNSEGFVYQHNDGLNNIGLWVMPNNCHEGMLEDWIKSCMHTKENELFEHVVASIDNIPDAPKFKPIHKSKAEVATWLAWQTKPGHGLYQTIESDLLDVTNNDYQQLVTWLKTIFPT